MEKDKRATGPDRLTFHHAIALQAGEKFLKIMVEELNHLDKTIAAEWVKQAKKRNGIGPIEFLAEKAETSESRILAVASRLSGAPIVDCEQVLAPNDIHWVVDGLPMTLLSSTAYGAKTIVHTLPFLETLLDREFLGDIYNGIKINFALTTPAGMLKHIQRTYNSGRARNRLLLRSDDDVTPGFSKEIEILRSKELLEADFNRQATRQEIITALEDDRPRKGAPGETEWWALCSEHPFVQLAPINSTRELIEIIDPATQKRYGVVPVCEHGGILTVGTKRGIQGILRQEIIGELQKHCKLTTIICPAPTINEIITNNLSNTISTTSIASQIQVDAAEEEQATEVIDIQELAENDDASIVRVVQSIMVGAINKRATDIHIAAHADKTWIRFRIDGAMVDAPYQLPAQFWKPVISRVKIMSAIDIRYSPTPLDGKFPMKIAGIDYDIRVNTCTTIYGEKAVMRIQKKDEDIPTLDSLGYQPNEKKLIENLIDSDHGLMLVCGPTGSGKTRTLSTVMHMIDRQKWNVITAENPVEIRIPGVEQTQIDGHQMTFAKFVPAALRADPDFIMIGETRDQETTEEVIRASITGHIVMTTLHSNSAAGAPIRLIDMGGEPFLLTDSIKVVLAQRLIRRLCTNCCRPTSRRPYDEELISFGINPEWLAGAEHLLEGAGCKICNGSGYAGRIAIAEGYGMSSEIRRIILKENADSQKIKEQMIVQGGKPLIQSAVELAARGVTSLQEALALRDAESGG